MHRVELVRQAEKQLEAIFRADRSLYERFLNAFREIAKDPAIGKRLHGKLQGVSSYRLGNYRILYEAHHGRLLVVVIDLGHRREIYR